MSADDDPFIAFEKKISKAKEAEADILPSQQAIPTITRSVTLKDAVNIYNTNVAQARSAALARDAAKQFIKAIVQNSGTDNVLTVDGITVEVEEEDVVKVDLKQMEKDGTTPHWLHLPPKSMTNAQYRSLHPEEQKELSAYVRQMTPKTTLKITESS